MPADARIVLSHPGTGIFVQQVGRALYEAGRLQRFLTTLVDRPDALWRRWAARNPRFDRLLRRRAIQDFPATLAVQYPQRELLRLLVRQCDRGGVATDMVWEWAEHGFDAWAAQRLDGAQSVYAYEHAALATFQAARERGMRCIYDVPGTEPEFAQRVRNEEIAAHPELDSAYERRTREHCARRTARRRAEWHGADLIFTNSEFSKSTYAAAGLEMSKVRIIAPGAPPVRPESEDGPHRGGSGPVRFLFVGGVALHKGAHHLLAAWRRLRPPAGTAELEIVGDITLRAVLRDCPASVHFAGRLGPDAVFQRYRQADALVFPTLCDGFGMVVTEAFSQGLPVITTPRAGAAEWVREGLNGFVVPAADPEALARKLEWCLLHRADLYAMRAEARATAAAWQWSDYRRRLTEEILASPVLSSVCVGETVRRH
jgi:glycosyltransferase involved in cell wall biosynthesis